LHIIDRLGDAGLEIVERMLIAFKARRLLANQACGGILGMIAGDLHLLRQRKHVRRQTRGRQRSKIDLLVARLLGCFVEDCTGRHNSGAGGFGAGFGRIRKNGVPTSCMGSARSGPSY
jgi:hypothetical protein